MNMAVNIYQFSKQFLKLANALPGGLADTKKPADFDQRELSKGIKIELEHTKDRQLAQEIAMDHLMEDPKYYSKLEVLGL